MLKASPADGSLAKGSLGPLDQPFDLLVVGQICWQKAALPGDEAVPERIPGPALPWALSLLAVD